MEAEGDQVFLEAKVLKTSEGVVCRLNNKVVSDYLAQGAKYRVRLHSLKLVSVDKAMEEVSGIATRCVQYATNATQLKISLLELRLEVCLSELPDKVFWKALRLTLLRYKSNEMVQECRQAKDLVK